MSVSFHRRTAATVVLTACGSADDPTAPSAQEPTGTPTAGETAGEAPASAERS